MAEKNDRRPHPEAWLPGASLPRVDFSGDSLRGDSTELIRLASRVRRALLTQPREPPEALDVEVRDGGLVLHGRVRSVAAHDVALRRAQATAAPTPVIDRLVVLR